MIKWMKNLFQNKTMRYLFFGGCTTGVNLISYIMLRRIFGIEFTIANITSITLAIMFAYIVNKVFVFESKTKTFKTLLPEALQFFGMRLGTMAVEVFGVVMLSSVLGLDDVIAKLFIQVVVLVLNYMFSKFYVFKDKKNQKIRSRDEQKFQRMKKLCCIWGFGIPVFTVTLGFAVNRVFPFGDRGVLIIDSLHQYLPFFTEFHEKLANGDTLLYSFGGGLGFNFWATYAYYLASPMNFLVTLFPKANMMDVMALLIILKIGFSGLTMSYYLVHRNRGKNYLPVLFGVMFALSSFMIGYYFNLMWLDSIAMLPLVMMGIERIIQGKSGKMFCLSLFYGLYCNYYIGFMLCLFACLYFLVQWVSAEEFSVKKIGKSCAVFAWYALLAGGMAAIVLVPAYLGLGITESAENGFPDKIKFYVENLSQLTSQFAFVEPVNIADGQSEVNSFCGVATLILAGFYAVNKNIKKRERIAKLALCILLYASFNINILNFIWHGFHTQNGLPNRFAFIYTAMLLVLSFDAISDIRELSWRRLLPACLVPVLFVVTAWTTGLGERKLLTYLITLPALAIYTALFCAYRAGKFKKRTFYTTFIALGMLEITANAIFGIVQNGTIGRNTYLPDQYAYEALMERRGDETFFRSDIDSTKMRNTNMFMGANGVVLFSSTMPAATVDLCKSLGIEARTNKNGYNGFTKLMNDLFAMKYVVSKTDSPALYQMTKVDREAPLTLYQNPGALSLGFMVKREIKDWNIREGAPFDVQNSFVELATGHFPIFFQNQIIDMEDQETYQIIIPAGKQVYLDVTKAVEVIAITTPEYEKKYDKYNDHLYDLGCFEEDTTATVKATFKEGQKGSVQANVYVCDDSTYDEVHQILAAAQLQTTVIKDRQISGSIQVKEAGTLLLSVPYDQGWKACVDGKAVLTYPVGEALTGIDLEPGEHELTMAYTAPGLWLGSGITLVCIGLYVVSAAVGRRKER